MKYIVEIWTGGHGYDSSSERIHLAVEAEDKTDVEMPFIEAFERIQTDTRNWENRQAEIHGHLVYMDDFARWAAKPYNKYIYDPPEIYTLEEFFEAKLPRI